MNIRINSIKLTNFKCFSDREFVFGGDVTTIQGRNGEGKTTIADAIIFCLFGKDTEGRSDLDIFKTIDKETGKPIPHLDHSVEMELTISASGMNDGSTLNLKRVIKEDWVKKRGATESVFKNNKQEFFINGNDTTPTDYKKYIDGLVSEKAFRAITNPTEFTSWHWKEQRAFLTEMVGEIEPDTGGVGFVALLKALRDSGEDVEAYLKHVHYQIKNIKEKLERIPIRLEEQNKALPEKLDWDSVAKEVSEKQAELSALEEKVVAIKSGNGADIKRMEIRNLLTELQASLDAHINAAREKANSLSAAHRELVMNESVKFNEALNNQKIVEQAIEADKRLIENIGTTDYEAELQKLRDQWPSNKFEIDPNLQICPTCGQPIPDELYAEKVAEMKKNFNLQREAKIKSLNEQAAKIKKNQSDAADELKRLQDKLESDTNQLQDIKESINVIFAEKANIEKQKVETFEEILSKDSDYIELKAKDTELREQLNSITDSEEDKEMLANLIQQKENLRFYISSQQYKIGQKEQYEKILKLIDEIKEEEKNLIEQLSELEKREDVARNYQTKQNQILESKINEHFKIVRWKLFKTINNGGDSFEEPFCECYINGIPFHAGLNQAAKLNAGLDIINALCGFYHISAPICIDNSESNLNILDTEGQQIRLQVFDSDLQLV